MALSVLITQCLQRDFVAPLGRHDPLPNRLHVGHSEAQRLLGADPRGGPVAQVMSWARAQPTDALEILHIRDWHDPDDPRQRDHLATFGRHCIRNTPGAELVLDLDDGLAGRPNERVVDSIALNDFEATALPGMLDELRRRAHPEPLRVAVVGVWTEAKISFLLYDLKTRLGVDELATCSALTASASRAQHFNALEQLRRVLGVECFGSVGELTSWLNPGSTLELPRAPARFGPKLHVSSGDISLGDDDLAIVGDLYRNSPRIELEPLSGGFSGALVFKASSDDSLGHQQAPSVVKLGPSRMIARERVAFERVEEVLGNNAPAVRGFAELGGRAGIKYSYAAMGGDRIRTLKSLFEDDAPQDQLDAVIRAVFEVILGPLYAAARYEKLPILEHYGFSTEWAPSVRENVTKIVGERARDPELTFPGDYRVPNVCRFYESFLQRKAVAGSEFRYVSVVHGDLNGANILLDGRDNVWVIDFFHTGPGHVLKDVAKLENDLLYVFTPLGSSEELREALLITRALRDVVDLLRPLPERLEGLRSPALLRAWSCLRTLRAIAAQLCREDRHPLQLTLPLLRYAVHTLTFEEASPLQKEWALAAACGLAEDAMRTTLADEALRVDWLDASSLNAGSVGPGSSHTGSLGPGRLGMTICPGRRDHGRALAVDLDALRGFGVSRHLCLLSDEELAWAGVAGLAGEMAARSIELRQLPIRDQGAPGFDDAFAVARWCLEATRRGQHVTISCMGGLGRAGTIAACVLVLLGSSAEEAIAQVRKARGPRAVETRVQEAFVARFADGCRP